MDYSLSPLGDNAVVIEVSKTINLASQKKVQTIAACLNEFPPPWMIEYIPAYTTITVFYNIEYFISDRYSPVQAVCYEIDKLLLTNQNSLDIDPKVVKIPVLYGDIFGPDLQFVAKHNNLREEEVIEIHTSGDYTVHMIGFAPGFPFIGGMSEKIAAPRRNTPRLAIPARTVGIAGAQTGVYPIETPGGWQLIGRTPLELFLPDAGIPSLLKAGDKIQFYQITKTEYDEMAGGEQ